MTKKEKQNKIQGKVSQKTTWLLFLISAFSIVYCSGHQAHPTQNTNKSSILETLTGVPTKIIHNAWENGGLQVLLFANSKEKHAFAKGYPTRFGQMSFSADSHLKHKYGWSEDKIHNMGHRYGFSQKWQ